MEVYFMSLDPVNIELVKIPTHNGKAEKSPLKKADAEPFEKTAGKLARSMSQGSIHSPSSQKFVLDRQEIKRNESVPGLDSNLISSKPPIDMTKPVGSLVHLAKRGRALSQGDAGKITDPEKVLKNLKEIKDGFVLEKVGEVEKKEEDDDDKKLGIKKEEKKEEVKKKDEPESTSPLVAKAKSLAEKFGIASNILFGLAIVAAICLVVALAIFPPSLVLVAVPLSFYGAGIIGILVSDNRAEHYQTQSKSLEKFDKDVNTKLEKFKVTDDQKKTIGSDKELYKFWKEYDEAPSTSKKSLERKFDLALKKNYDLLNAKEKTCVEICDELKATDDDDLEDLLKYELAMSDNKNFRNDVWLEIFENIQSHLIKPNEKNLEKLEKIDKIVKLFSKLYPNENHVYAPDAEKLDTLLKALRGERSAKDQQWNLLGNQIRQILANAPRPWSPEQLEKLKEELAPLKKIAESDVFKDRYEESDIKSNLDSVWEGEKVIAEAEANSIYNDLQKLQTDQIEGHIKGLVLTDEVKKLVLANVNAQINNICDEIDLDRSSLTFAKVKLRKFYKIAQLIDPHNSPEKDRAKHLLHSAPLPPLR